MTTAALHDEALRYPIWVVQVCAIIAPVTFMLMLAPQAVKNFERQSTQGMSTGSMVIWHIGALLGTGYYLALPQVDVVGVSALGGFTLLCGLIHSQIVAYRGRTPLELTGEEKPVAASAAEPSYGCFPGSALAADGGGGTMRQFTLHAALTFFTALNFVLVTLLFLLFRAIPDEVTFLVGDVGCTALWVVGFVPQMIEFLITGDISGYSFGLSALDVLGCLANTLVIYADRGRSFGDSLSEALPFVFVIFMHALLVLIAVFVVYFPPNRPAIAQASVAV